MAHSLNFLHDSQAFSSSMDTKLVRSQVRSTLEVPRTDGCNPGGVAFLNVEWFGEYKHSSLPILAFVPGVCESAETWAVQNLARACEKARYRLVVLELEGHGLSTGPRAVCGDFDFLVSQVVAFGEMIDQQCPKWVLSGVSLGGVLAAYAAEHLSSSTKLCGVCLISPAVGVAPEALPPLPVVSALSLLAWVAPSAAIGTPVEDPTHYACPGSSTRNFSGHWPLATAKMLLDVTSGQVEKDQEGGKVILEKVPQILVITGRKDPVVPVASVQAFFNRLNVPVRQKWLEVVEQGDHGLLVSRTTSGEIVDDIMNWIETSCLDS